jgi:hypothetical protein
LNNPFKTISNTSIQIRRLDSWRDEQYLDRQPAETVSLFFIAVGIYAVLLVVDIFNIINAGITLW